MTLELETALRAAKAIPPMLQADWDGTNHFELQNTDANAHEFFWLILSDLVDDNLLELSADTELGKRIGAMMDAACAAPVLAAEVERLRQEKREHRTLLHDVERAFRGLESPAKEHAAAQEVPVIKNRVCAALRKMEL